MSKVGAVLAALVLLIAVGGSAEARQKRAGTRRRGGNPEQIVIGDGEVATTKSTKKEKVFDFTDFSIEGKLRTPQLLYFLGRARSELERASLRERSFIPEMVRSADAEGL